MTEAFYKKLQKNLVRIRALHFSGGYDRDIYESATASIKDARRAIDTQGDKFEKRVMLYCIDTLFDILLEGDDEKVIHYTDAIHNVPEIFMQRRNLYSFRQEFDTFRRRYGEHYFPFIYDVRPVFTKKSPKNKWEYFSRSADEDFKLLHPVLYPVIATIGCASFILPVIIYYICVLAFSLPNEWPVISGMVGVFIFGIGLFNIVAAWMHQYLGHLLTAVCLIGGALITAVSMLLLCC